MTADPSPHEKALLERVKDFEFDCLASGNATGTTLMRDLTAYLTARVPDDVGEVVKELRELEADATPGPWHANVAYDSRLLDTVEAEYASGERYSVCMVGASEPDQQTADTQFIAACREAVPLLLEAITRQSDRIAGLEAEVERLKNMLGNGLVSIPVLSTRTEE